MLQVDEDRCWFEGAHGTLPVLADDEVILKLAMLVEGECEGLGAAEAARKFGYSPQRYYQLLSAFGERGAAALKSAKRGPKTNYPNFHTITVVLGHFLRGSCLVSH
jgi:hypothetical protein